MAKVSGRVSWIAWPAMLGCLVVIGALVWLAVPGVPGAITFIGNTLRGATSPPAADSANGAPAEPATDCRSLYPDRLWSALTWTPEVLLSENRDAPATATTLPTALSAEVRFTCTWRADDGRSIQTSVSGVSGDASVVAAAALTADGFACADDGHHVHCERTRDTVTEQHDLRGDTWVSSVLTAWTPEDYGSQVVSRAFPG